ncbi:hypothetical protein BDP81DRAFT_158336 [Colletotrichum phormii]|uniref:Uncharacterized protein n=1 Tax=Colletotrichum phormii TaxID=359342 RepID=A0AAI9ZXQ1_9PEZI|nr:uncharacterized protein BDP81DRAFT_158336 [Colletotrichum phormii]KAK1640093.1 hypothetical protein BDP81DRAFT_158336 [Colletotrichum phormii]
MQAADTYYLITCLTLAAYFTLHQSCRGKGRRLQDSAGCCLSTYALTYPSLITSTLATLSITFLSLGFTLRLSTHTHTSARHTHLTETTLPKHLPNDLQLRQPRLQESPTYTTRPTFERLSLRRTRILSYHSTLQSIALHSRSPTTTGTSSDAVHRSARSRHLLATSATPQYIEITRNKTAS